MPTSGPGANRMLLTDADRDRLVELLARHSAAGTLSTDELERRVTAVYEAQTRDQATALVADLPPLGGGAPPKRAFWRRGHAEAESPDAAWTPTNERFRDPRSQRILRVWVDPASGTRHYVPDQAD
jgi:hypothetical protein